MNIFDAELISAVGWAVAHFLWQGVVIGGLIGGILHFCKKQNAQFRYLIGCVGLLLCPVIFFGTIQHLLVDETLVGSAVVPSVSNPAESLSQSTPAFDFSQLIAGLWLVGVVFMLIRFTRQGWQARALRLKETRPPDPKWQGIFLALKSILQIPAGVQMYQSASAYTPMVVGCLKPIILIPTSAFLSLSPDQLRAIILHELAHIKRQDHWVNLVQNLIETVLFFHPVVWWLSGRIRIEREYCCDELAVQMSEDPKDLAEALWQIESLRLEDTQLGLAASGGSLKDRIARILGISLQTNHSSRSYPIMKTKNLGTLFIALFLTAGGLYLANAEDRISKEELKERREEIKEAVKSGEISKEEAKEKLKDLKNKAKKKSKSKNDQEEDAGDLEELEKDLREAVESGKISDLEARQKLIKARAQKMHQEARRHQEHVRRKIEQASKQIREAVESGEMSEEKGRARLRELHKDAAEEARRLHQEVHKRNVQLHLEHTELVLRRQVEAGNLSEEQAHQKLEGIREQMKRNHGRRQQLEAKVKEEGRRIRKAVESGEISREDAEAKFKEIHRNAERRFKEVHQRDAEEDKSKQFYKFREEIQQAVKEGKLDEEEAEAKLNAVHRKLWGNKDDRGDDDDDGEERKYRRKHHGDDDDDDEGEERRSKRGKGDDDDDDRKRGKGDDDDRDSKRGKGDDDDHGKKRGDDDEDDDDRRSKHGKGDDDDDDKRKSDDDDD